MAKIAASPEGALFNQVVGLVGLLLGGIGFGVTILQIFKIRSVADAQNDAILNLRFRLSQLDVVAECTKAESALIDLKHDITENAGSIQTDALDRLITAFIMIFEGSAAISAEVKERLQSAISDLNKLADYKPRGNEVRSTQKQMAGLRDIHGLIIKIRAQTQEEHRA